MLICGVDEAGRGPLAGPVVAAAVVFPENYTNPELRDSKQLSAARREHLSSIIKRDALHWAIIAVGPRRIEQLNILGATKLAMRLAVYRVKADKVLIDGNQLIHSGLEEEAIVKGDQLIMQISAASILAKVWRDKLMVTIGAKYPGYGMEKHAGYPTPSHRSAIKELGPSRVHRRTFGGVREYLGNTTLCAANT